MFYLERQQSPYFFLEILRPIFKWIHLSINVFFIIYPHMLQANSPTMLYNTFKPKIANYFIYELPTFRQMFLTD